MSQNYERVVLDRDCTATVIPGGEPMLLSQGEQVIVTQTLGGSVTVQTEMGYLVRINAEDSAALGLAEPVAVAPAVPATTFEIDHVIDSLKNVFDPEIPINVVDLGLIYSCEASALPDGTQRIQIEMSMTAPGCGMGDVLREDARTAASMVRGVSEVDVELVWDPPWGMDRMSDAARLQLGLM
ncbi:MAG: putative Fe-S cluster assembly protein SufT [Jatrophihabitantaceae bacterium]